jgi:hypothetical protein
MVAAAPTDVWTELTDWVGQERWIPLTTMRVISDHAEGLGARIKAQHGLPIGKRRLGISDELLITSWEPPYELEVTHLGPWFTGEGVFTIEGRGRRSWLSVRERIKLPGGRPIESAVMAVRPVLQRQLAGSLKKFARVVADRVPEPTELADPARRYLSRHNRAATFVEEAKKRARRQQRRVRS